MGTTGRMALTVKVATSIILLIHCISATTVSTPDNQTEDFTDVTTDSVTLETTTTAKRPAPPPFYNPWMCYFRVALWTNITVLEKECLCWRRDPCVKTKRLGYFDKTDQEDWEKRKDKYIALSALYAVAWFIGVSGNILVIIAVFIYLRKDSVTNIFLAGLAFADLILVFICFPLRLIGWVLPNYWPLGHVLCILSYFLKDFSFACSVLTLTLISVERYMAICQPMKAQRVNSPSRSRRLLALVWLFALLFAAPNGYMIDLYDRSYLLDTEMYVCSLRRTKTDQFLKPLLDPTIYRLYNTLLFGVVYVVPVVAMTVSYTAVSVTLWKSIKTAKAMQGGGSGGAPNPEKEEKMAKETQKRVDVIKMLVTVLAIFIVCWSPFLFYSMYTSYEPNLITYKNQQEILDITFYLETLAYFNSIMNPLLYAFLSSQFRGVFVAIMTCKCKKMEQIMGPPSSSFAKTRTTQVPQKSEAPSAGPPKEEPKAEAPKENSDAEAKVTL